MKICISSPDKKLLSNVISTIKTNSWITQNKFKFYDDPEQSHSSDTDLTSVESVHIEQFIHNDFVKNLFVPGNAIYQGCPLDCLARSIYLAQTDPYISVHSDDLINNIATFINKYTHIYILISKSDPMYEFYKKAYDSLYYIVEGVITLETSLQPHMQAAILIQEIITKQAEIKEALNENSNNWFTRNGQDDAGAVATTEPIPE